jgi:ribosomal protein S18 acetylase RimI-like enzyme
MGYIIRQVKEEEYAECVEVIRKAFGTVAKEFGLTRENAPTNPAFIELRHLDEMRNKGIRMYGLFAEEGLAGFVALERLQDGAYSMKRLAVLPECRHNGYGKALMRHVVGVVHGEGGTLLKIGVINENAVLKKWYEDFGFIETSIVKYESLPFTVCYMELAV